MVIQLLDAFFYLVLGERTIQPHVFLDLER
jgi:hypothetical protein